MMTTETTTEAPSALAQIVNLARAVGDARVATYRRTVARDECLAAYKGALPQVMRRSMDALHDEDHRALNRATDALMDALRSLVERAADPDVVATLTRAAETLRAERDQLTDCYAEALRERDEARAGRLAAHTEAARVAAERDLARTQRDEAHADVCEVLGLGIDASAANIVAAIERLRSACGAGGDQIVELHNALDLPALASHEDALAEIGRLRGRGLPRIETGTVRFEDDWPGVFIRGDHAAIYAEALYALLNPGAPAAFGRENVRALWRLLTESREHDGQRLQQIDRAATSDEASADFDLVRDCLDMPDADVADIVCEIERRGDAATDEVCALRATLATVDATARRIVREVREPRTRAAILADLDAAMAEGGCEGVALARAVLDAAREHVRSDGRGGYALIEAVHAWDAAGCPLASEEVRS